MRRNFFSKRLFIFKIVLRVLSILRAGEEADIICVVKMKMVYNQLLGKVN